MAKLSLTEAVCFALEHMPGELNGVLVGAGKAYVSLKDAAGVYTFELGDGSREEIAQAVRDRRARRWQERERMGKL